MEDSATHAALFAALDALVAFVNAHHDGTVLSSDQYEQLLVLDRAVYVAVVRAGLDRHLPEADESMKCVGETQVPGASSLSPNGFHVWVTDAWRSRTLALRDLASHSQPRVADPTPPTPIVTASGLFTTRELA